MIHRILAAVSAIAFAAALGGCATKPDPEPATASMRGLETARRHCAACHAVEPAGGVSPRERAPAFASLEMRHTASLEGRVADLTRLGHYGMPPVSLSADQVLDLVAYINSLDSR